MGKKQTSLVLVECRVLAEKNIDSWPIFVPSDSRAIPEVRAFIRQVRQRDGTLVKVSVEVSYDPKLGQLTTDDEKVLFVLYKVCSEQIEAEKFRFSLCDLAHQLGRDGSGGCLREIARSLERLRSVRISWRQSFKLPGGKILHLNQPITILSHLVIAQVEQGKHRTTDRCEARFDEAILNNLRDVFIRPIRLDVVLRLRSGVAQLIYRHVDPILHHTPAVTRMSGDLFAALGLDAHEYRYASRRRRTLDRALKELQGVALSTENYALVCRMEKITARGEDFAVVFERRALVPAPAPEAAAAPETIGAGQPPPEPPPTQPQASQKPKRGRPVAVAPDPAADLVRHFHTTFHGLAPDACRPTAKEVGQARDLLTRAGDFDAARSVVDYALAEALKTAYRPAVFGGILQYVDRALDALGGRAAERTADAQPDEEKMAACGICVGAGVLIARWPDGQTKPVPCPHDRALVSGWIAEKTIVIETRDGQPVALGDDAL